ncbi:MAG: aminotransferase [Acidimicrobiales bacterium]
MRPANSVMAALGTTVFEVMSRLSEQHQSVNLGQGFPDDPGPDDVRAKAAEEAVHGWNQYPSMMGVPELRQAVADHDRRFYGIELDWQREVMVTSGGTEALAAALFGLLEPGDEAVLFQPLYDSYLPIVRRAGATPRLVSLALPDWSFTAADLDRAFSERTKVVVLNNPLNPAGKVFTRAELDLLAEYVERFDAYVVCDEVYEHLVFDGRAHHSFLALPGMRERAVKIGSAGKTFSLTGWKVGYVSAAADTLTPIAKTHQFLTYTTPPNLQQGVALGLRKSDDYFADLAAAMAAKRDRLAAGLKQLGFDVLACGGAYFLCVDIRSVGWEGDDVAFCRWLTTDVGVTAIPVSAFYDEAPLTTVARFCFCKKDDTLDRALDRLAKQFG